MKSIFQIKFSKALGIFALACAFVLALGAEVKAQTYVSTENAAQILKQEIATLETAPVNKSASVQDLQIQAAKINYYRDVIGLIASSANVETSIVQGARSLCYGDVESACIQLERSLAISIIDQTKTLLTL
jgi:hypothetical protein